MFFLFVYKWSWPQTGTHSWWSVHGSVMRLRQGSEPVKAGVGLSSSSLFLAEFGASVGRGCYSAASSCGPASRGLVWLCLHGQQHPAALCGHGSELMRWMPLLAPDALLLQTREHLSLLAITGLIQILHRYRYRSSSANYNSIRQGERGTCLKA